MNRRNIILSALALFALTVQAAERTEAEMLSIASEQLSSVAKARGANGTHRLNLAKVMTADQFNVYEAQDKSGFVVVSRDDAFAPVLGYAEGAFATEAQNPALNWWLKAINKSLGVRKAAKPKYDFTPVADLLTTRWGQGSPYNFSCPTQNGIACLTGCAATALSQLLYYYKYPEKSVGTGSYTVGNSQINTVELGTTFAWGTMRNSYTASAYSNTVKKAIGELMRDCGYAVNMSYSVTASGCYPNDVATALIRNLQFDTLAVNYARRDFYSDEEWMSIIYSELGNNRPILYTGTDGGYGGHIFVLTGIDENGLIFCNWGWNGDGNGFFDIDDLVVNNILGAEELDFSYEQHMIFGVNPTEKSTPANYVYSRWVTDDNRYTLQTRSVNQIQLGGFSLYNHNYLLFNGTIELVFAADDGKLYEIPLEELQKEMPQAGVPTWGGFNVPANMRLDVSAVPAGKYNVYLATKANGERRPSHLRCKGTGAIEFPVDKYESGSMTIYDSRVVNAVNNTADDNVSHRYEFIDKDGNVVANGSTLTLTEIEEDPFGDDFISSGLYVKNVTGDETTSLRISYNILELSNGSFQICFPSACVYRDAVGPALTPAGSMTAGEVRDLQTEWFPKEYGSCVVELQIQEGVRDAETRLFTKTADGPKVTLRFVHADPSGIKAQTADGKNVIGRYTLDGRQAGSPAKGIYIIRQSDGTVKKVINR